MYNLPVAKPLTGTESYNMRLFYMPLILITEIFPAEGIKLQYTFRSPLIRFQLTYPCK